ncbi:hypothetical protein UCRPA7_6264 [Phaeoacremonium minimum UCRPA7]|uniref:SnoaL-like domain-containing protein n=1 Tax=Phaeoacremonium minimum (strain UCR-PA7) TaxID=1286976 RepID=R8BFZ4_PHAM7|nr:hypothetical protein UCRPA7_6264 [Phaeoacremonium minimum UCRPA7]EON98209.1 hypothetical protein UCRPA7_6264 [Phaeoacremonium minimum UCRPA7]
MAQTTIHHGPSTSIPSGASPGLQFLKGFLAVLDSLDPDQVQTLTNFLTPDAAFAINGGAPVPTEQVLSMLTMRGQKLARFGHEVHVAWDIESGAGSRTVMYESTSVTVFKDDPAAAEIRVREFNIVELVGGGQDGASWKAKELRTFMDASAVYKHAQSLQAKAD